MSNSIILALAAMFGVSAVLSVVLYGCHRNLNAAYEKAAREAFGNSAPLG